MMSVEAPLRPPITTELDRDERNEAERRRREQAIRALALLSMLASVDRYTGAPARNRVAYSGPRHLLEFDPNKMSGIVNLGLRNNLRFVGDDDGPVTPDMQPEKPAPYPASAHPDADLRSAPSMYDEALGPQLPDLPFVLEPQSARPTEADNAAAARANDMYQRELFKAGWQGGKITAEQERTAYHAIQRQLHPDQNPDASATDAETLRVVNAGRKIVKQHIGFD